MKPRAFALACAAAVLTAGALSLSAQGAPPGRAGQPPMPPAPPAVLAPRGTPPGPNISGIWSSRYVPSLAPNPPLLPAAEAIMKARKPEDDPMARCLPPGVPRVGSTAFPIEIVQTPTHVAILYEYDHFVRRIYTDGRKHPDDLDGNWLGHSIGHWEGNTLIADTVGFNGISWLDEVGHPTSDALHIIERYTLSADLKTIQHEITIDDPKMYSQPWKSTKTYTARNDMQIMEFVCESKER